MSGLRNLVVALVPLAISCGQGTTGSGLFDFEARASGPANTNGSYLFVNDLGFEVELRAATLQIGGVYLNQNVPREGAQEQPCVLPGLYVAQVTTGLELDVLRETPSVFPAEGNALIERARSAELWLKADDVNINAPDDASQIVWAEGVARRGGTEWPFETRITIGNNRRIPDPDPQRPGANPICAERIVSRIPVAITPQRGGTLSVRVDPGEWFAQVDFSALREEDIISEDPLLYRIPDAPDGQPALTLFNGLKSVAAYDFEWR